jgi:small subunit ribosomal protein S11
MGKKKVIQKTQEEIIAENKLVEDSASAKKSAALGKKKLQSGRIYIQSSYNNTIISVTDDAGNVITWMSAGSLGFSGPKKATPFAASKIAEAIAQKIEKTGPFDVRIYVSGVGAGRDSAIRSFVNKGFNILSIKDITPIPHNGPRPPKVRRV